MNKNNISKRILQDLEDILDNKDNDSYLDAVDDLLEIVEQFSNNEAVKKEIDDLLDSNSGDKSVYQLLVGDINQKLMRKENSHE